MATQSGRHAGVVGAGMGGLATAAALTDHFEGVTVLDRDVLPTDGSPRSGIPQGKHVHVLLAGGHQAISDMLLEVRHLVKHSSALDAPWLSDLLDEATADA